MKSLSLTLIYIVWVVACETPSSIANTASANTALGSCEPIPETTWLEVNSTVAGQRCSGSAAIIWYPDECDIFATDIRAHLLDELSIYESTNLVMALKYEAHTRGYRQYFKARRFIPGRPAQFVFEWDPNANTQDVVTIELDKRSARSTTLRQHLRQNHRIECTQDADVDLGAYALLILRREAKRICTELTRLRSLNLG